MIKRQSEVAVVLKRISGADQLCFQAFRKGWKGLLSGCSVLFVRRNLRLPRVNFGSSDLVVPDLFPLERSPPNFIGFGNWETSRS